MFCIPGCAAGRFGLWMWTFPLVLLIEKKDTPPLSPILYSQSERDFEVQLLCSSDDLPEGKDSADRLSWRSPDHTDLAQPKGQPRGQ